jgi:hypothetical protein
MSQRGAIEHLDHIDQIVRTVGNASPIQICPYGGLALFGHLDQGFIHPYPALFGRVDSRRWPQVGSILQKDEKAVRMKTRHAQGQIENKNTYPSHAAKKG